MKRRLLAVLLIGCLLLSGCMSRQLEEQLLVIILAVDEMENGDIRLSVKVPSNSGVNSSSGGGNGSSDTQQMGYFLLEATGKTFPDAANLLHATTPRSLNFSQVREVVIGERASRSSDFSGIIQSVYLLPQMRAQASLVVCGGEARPFIAEQKPYVGIRLSRYIETTLVNYAGKGFVPTTTLGDAVRDLGYGFQDPLLIYGAINPFDSVDHAYDSNVLDEQAGELPRKSVNAIELFGAAATDGVSVSGLLTGYEMALLHLLSGTVQSLTIRCDDSAAVPIFARSPAGLWVEIDTGKTVLGVRLLCEAHFTPGQNLNAEALRQTLAQDIHQTLVHLQRLRCDGMGFGNLASQQFLTIQDWEAYHWREAYVSADIQVNLALQIRNN